MTKYVLTMVFLLVDTLCIVASPIDSLEEALRSAPIQEKVYVHIDNTCYYAGDTIWYKAYVVRADNLKPTDMSHMLYVELLTPDGYLVERQTLAVDERKGLCGQFALTDTMYSGYYEIRAYTRWQLNFNVTQQKYNRITKEKFITDREAEDFFRDYDGLWSRVVPIYEKPQTQGDYEERYMVARPKRRIKKTVDDVLVSFYPEGGTLVSGVPCRVAFEITDAYGMPLDITGRMDDGTILTPSYMGRGSFSYLPNELSTRVTFCYKEKEYKFKLPDIDMSGTALCYDIHSNTLSVTGKGVSTAALSISCRGHVGAFLHLHGDTLIKLDDARMPVGVNEIVVYDAAAIPIASRQIFVSDNACSENKVARMNCGVQLCDSTASEIDGDKWIKPYSGVSLNMSSQDNGLHTVSISVRDGWPDAPSYDDGNIMTDILLTSDLKGFVANPSYYFEKIDSEHLSRLDLLMMIQGWRKYKPVAQIRYQPEKTPTYVGRVYKQYSDVISENEFKSYVEGKSLPEGMKDEENSDGLESNNGLENNVNNSRISATDISSNGRDDEDIRFKKRKTLKKTVVVEAEIEKAGQSAGTVVSADSEGRFMFQIPPYYGKAVLFVQAYEPHDSVRRSIASRQNKYFADGNYIPDYYVKRDLFYPVFSKPYSWLQTHEPEEDGTEEGSSDSLLVVNNSLSGDHLLPTVKVKASRRRGMRDFDRSKPAFVLNFKDAFNYAVDRGVTYGYYDCIAFPCQLTCALVGNMANGTPVRTKAVVDGHVFLTDYRRIEDMMGVERYDGKNMTPELLYSKLSMKRLKKIKVYTDYDLRNRVGKETVNNTEPDIMYIFEDYEDDASVMQYADRRYILDGFTYPEKFYSPDYSHFIPAEPNDYRRTLYWNPSAAINADGTFQDTFFTGSRPSQLHISACGIGQSGMISIYNNTSK